MPSAEQAKLVIGRSVKWLEERAVPPPMGCTQRFAVAFMDGSSVPPPGPSGGTPASKSPLASACLAVGNFSAAMSSPGSAETTTAPSPNRTSIPTSTGRISWSTRPARSLPERAAGKAGWELRVRRSPRRAQRGFVRALVHRAVPANAYGLSFDYGSWEYLLVPRGTAGRNPSDFGIDLHASYPIRVGKTIQVRVQGDVFDPFNRQAILSYDQRYNRFVDGPCGGVPDGLCNGDGGLATQPGTLVPLGAITDPRRHRDQPGLSGKGHPLQRTAEPAAGRST